MSAVPRPHTWPLRCKVTSSGPEIIVVYRCEPIKETAEKISDTWARMPGPTRNSESVLRWPRGLGHARDDGGLTDIRSRGERRATSRPSALAPGKPRILDSPI